MKYVVAVSGGVDSVVLLDMLVRAGEHELVVAHFDHGIREESDADARFVAELAEQYGLPFEMRREELGRQASEALARERRYAFLEEVATRHGARLATAHHLDDLVETIAINLHRGTGWRGLAVLSNPKIDRPLLARTKAEVYEYALAHKLEWVEDKTNLSDKYLRNRLRSQLRLNETTKRHLAGLRQAQLELRQEIDEEVDHLLTERAIGSRYYFILLDDMTTYELLRGILARSGRSLTRPQLERLQMMIKTARPGSVFEAGGGVKVRFTRTEFIVNDSL